MNNLSQFRCGNSPDGFRYWRFLTKEILPQKLRARS
jgi:hypothetical protein